jgi:hypothetical protein
MKLTHIALVLAMGLLGLTTWLAWDARVDAKGAHNRLELAEQQKGNGPTPAAVQERENQILMQQMAGKKGAPAPTAPPSNTSPPPLPPAGTIALAGGSKIDMSHTGTSALEAPPPPLSARQRMVMSVPAIGKVTEFQKQYGFVIIAAGSNQKLEKGMSFALRRGPGIIGRIHITEVENSSAVADLDARTVPAGVTVESGDDVIQDLPPEA